MKLHTCLGLSEYDTDTMYYYFYILLLCICAICSLQVHKILSIEVTCLFMLVVFIFNSLIILLIGILFGIIAARSTVHENLESLGYIKTDHSFSTNDIN